jgi:hypothetical protein
LLQLHPFKDIVHEGLRLSNFEKVKQSGVRENVLVRGSGKSECQSESEEKIRASVLALALI